MTYDYDLFVIGGGSGGARAARIAAQHGARVGIAEADRFGGTCVIRGCVPKKLLVYASRFPDSFADAAGFGWSLPPAEFDWQSLIRHKNLEISRLEALYADHLKASGVRLHHSRARFESANELWLESEQRSVTAAKILIATGGLPYRDPMLPGGEHAISSDELFELGEFPRRIVICGGGYVALEFASLLNGLGSAVTVLHRGAQVLRGFDEELTGHLQATLAARGMEFRLEQTLTGIANEGGERVVSVRNGESIRADQVLMAIGRRANTRDLGLERIGLATGANGHLQVDTQSRTPISHIFAVGDVTQHTALTPVAIRDGHAFADREFGGQNRPLDHDHIPSAVFTTPELASVGLSEGQALEQGAAVDVYTSRFRPLDSMLSGRTERTLIKLVVEAREQRLLGAHMVGPGAAEMIQLLALPLRLAATKADLDATMALHPTAAEEWVTLRQPTRSHRK